MTEQSRPYVFIIEGTIQALRVAPGVVNLIKDLQAGAFWAGAVAGMAGEAGVLANAASLVLYEGEDVEHVALLINGKLAIGTFEWLRDLKVSDDVKLVVSEIDDGPLFVHAILRKNDHLLWMPPSVDHTRHGCIVHALKLGGSGVVFMWLMCGFCFLMGESHALDQLDLLITIFFPVAMMAFVMFMSTRGMMHLGDEAEDIFQALGVAKCERFRITPYSVSRLHYMNDPTAHKKRSIFQFSDALFAHTKKFNL
jgi:hypothetical protein